MDITIEILEQLIHDFQNKWTSHEEMREGLKEYAYKLNKL
jgi:uncharacterized membrane protein